MGLCYHTHIMWYWDSNLGLRVYQASTELHICFPSLS